MKTLKTTSQGRLCSFWEWLAAHTNQVWRILEDSEEEPSSPVSVSGEAAYLLRASHSPETLYHSVCVAVSPFCLCHHSLPSVSCPAEPHHYRGREILLPLVRIPSRDKNREGWDPWWQSLSHGCLALTIMPPLTTRQAALPTRYIVHCTHHTAVHLSQNTSILLPVQLSGARPSAYCTLSSAPCRQLIDQTIKWDNKGLPTWRHQLYHPY